MTLHNVYTIPRADFFTIPNRENIQILQAGPLWMLVLLSEDKVFELWCQGIVATPG